MAQYDQDVNTITEDVTAGLSEEAEAAISEILSGIANSSGKAKVGVVSAGDEIPEGLDLLVVEEGVAVKGTDATVIAAAPNAPLVVESLKATGQDRAIIGGDKADKISTASTDEARSAQRTTDDNILIEAGGGNDSISTGSGNDSVTGGAGNDSISTGAGNDIITVGSGADSVDAGSGIDKIISTQKSTDVTILIDAQGKITLTDKATGDITTVDNAEYIEFSDNVAYITSPESLGSSLSGIFALDLTEGGLKDFDNLSTEGSISALVDSYVASDAFKTSSNGVTDVDALANLIYSHVFKVDAGGETLKLWSTAIKTAMTMDSSTTADANAAVDDMQIVGTTLISFDEI